VKNHDFTPKNLIFSNFRGGGVRAGCAPHPPLAPQNLHIPSNNNILCFYLKVNKEKLNVKLYIYINEKIAPENNLLMLKVFRE
jgi:hypothetical protein